MGKQEKTEVSVWNIANALTIIRLILVPVFIWSLLVFTPERRWIGYVIFTLAAITDKIDGYLARKYNLITDFGKLADGIADKALIISALILCSYWSVLAWWITIAFIVREVFITVMRMVVVKKKVIAAGNTGKLKMVAQSFGLAGLIIPIQVFGVPALTLTWNWIAYILLLVALVLAYISAVEYIILACKD